MSTWNAITLLGLPSQETIEHLPDFDLDERSIGGNGWDFANTWVPELKEMETDYTAAYCEGRTKWRAEDVLAWVQEYTAANDWATIEWHEEWDDDEVGERHTCWKGGQLVIEDSFVSGMVPMDLDVILGECATLIDGYDNSIISMDGTISTAALAEIHAVGPLVEAFRNLVTKLVQS